MCSVFWLFWLSYQYLQWLARKTPLKKPNCDNKIISTKPRPKSTCDFFSLVYCSSICCVFVLFSGRTQYILYSYGTMKPVCGESAVKRHSADRPTCWLNVMDVFCCWSRLIVCASTVTVSNRRNANVLASVFFWPTCVTTALTPGTHSLTSRPSSIIIIIVC